MSQMNLSIPKANHPRRAGARPREVRPFEGTWGAYGAAPGTVLCPWCQRPTGMNEVHGHTQCVHCKTKFSPSFDGEGR